MKGIHYSDKVLDKGTTITSKVHENDNFEHFHALYAKVAKQLGLYFPNTYGYAYPIGIIRKHKHFKIVEAPNNKITKCDFRFSLTLLLEDNFYTPLALSRALADDSLVIENAKKYFNQKVEKEHTEYISDSFQTLS